MGGVKTLAVVDERAELTRAGLVSGDGSQSELRDGSGSGST